MSDLSERAKKLANDADTEIKAATGGPDHKMLILSNRGDQALAFLPKLAEEIETLEKAVRFFASKASTYDRDEARAQGLI